jgi:hypothetical protein
MLLASITRRSRRRSTGPDTSSHAPTRTDRESRRSDTPLSAVTGALVATATNAVVKLLGDAVPGFREELHSRSPRRPDTSRDDKPM